MDRPSLTTAQIRRLRPLADCPENSLVIHELYRSLQGEGLFAGLPCTFVRLAACHLRCGYCDTPHAFHEGATMTTEDIVERVLGLGERLVEVTGGEPLLQPGVRPLMTRLADDGCKVLLETSGSLDISGVDSRVHIIMDLKTPGSREVDANLWTNLDHLKPTDEIKLVICDRGDFDWAVSVVRQYGLAERFAILISPAFGSVDPTDLASWLLESGLPIRLQIQLHKILWDPARRGV